MSITGVRHSVLAIASIVVLLGQTTPAMPAPTPATTRDAVWANSNGQVVRPAREFQCPRRLSGPITRSADPSAPSAGPTTGGRASPLDESIRRLEQQLSKMKPGDPGYDQVKALLEQLKAKRDQSATSAPSNARPSAGPPAPVAPRAPADTRPLTLRSALGNIEAALEGSVTAEAWRGFEASPASKDPALAIETVATAIAVDRPMAALALLLAAQKLQPKDAEILINLAGLASGLGLPREALVLVDASDALPADPEGAWGMKTKALSLNVRGHALIGLGRPQEAEAVLRPAVTLEPLLAEARQNLALALGEQNKCKEGIRWARAGQWRTMLKDMMPVGGDPTKDEEPMRKPVRDVFDLSRGKPGRLPELRWGYDLEQAAGLITYYQNLGKEYSDRYKERSNKRTGVSKRLDAAPKPNCCTRARIQQITSALYGYEQEHYALYLKVKESRDALRAIKPPTIPPDQIKKCMDKAAGKWAEVNAAWQRYDTAVRAYFGAVYPYVTGLAANVSAPLLHEHFSLYIEEMADSTFSVDLVAQATTAAGAAAVLVSACSPNPAQTTDGPPVRRWWEDPEACIPASPRVKLAVFTLSVNCEKVSIEASDPDWIGPFIQVEYEKSRRRWRLRDPKERFLEEQAGRSADAHVPVLRKWGYAFDGKLTVFGGMKVDTGSALSNVVKLGFKEGVYTTWDGGGNMCDAGLRAEVTGEAGASLDYPLKFGSAVKVTGFKGKLSLMPSH